MSNARAQAIAYKSQSDIALSGAMVIDPYFVNESKQEEKSDALIKVKKHKVSESAQPLVELIAITFLLCPKNLKGVIPNAIWLAHILPFLVFDFKTCHTLARINKPVSLFFRKHLVDDRLEQLLQHIAYGEKEQIRKIIQSEPFKSNPRLLLCSGPIVKDYAPHGRRIQQSPYHMAIAAGDVYVKFKDGVYQPDAQGEEVTEMFESPLRAVCDETELMLHRDKLFPGGFEAYMKKIRAEALQAIGEMFKALSKAKAVDEAGLMEECKEDLKKFQKYLEPEGVITTGMHFPPQILDLAYEFYDDNFVLFGNAWNSPKNLFAWQKVVGLIQPYLTAVDGMALVQGPYYIVQQGQDLKREPRSALLRGTDPIWVLGKNCAYRAVVATF